MYQYYFTHPLISSLFKSKRSIKYRKMILVIMGVFDKDVKRVTWVTPIIV